MTRECCLVRVLSCICLRTQELSKHWSRIPLDPCRSLLLPWSHIAPCTGPRPHPSIMFPPSTLHPPLTPPPVSHGSSSTLHPPLTPPPVSHGSSSTLHPPLTPPPVSHGSSSTLHPPLTPPPVSHGSSSTLHPPLTPPPVSHGSSSTLHPSLTRPQCHMASSTSFSLRHLPGCLPFPPQPTPLSSLLTYLLFLLCDVHPCSSINSV